MRRPRPAVLATTIVAASLSLVAVGLAGAHGVSSLHAGERLARATDRTTAALDGQIALGRYAATHRRVEETAAATLDLEIPSQVDDRTILAAVVSAANASGANLADESRGQPATGAPGAAGLVRIPVTLDVNAPTLGALVGFAQELEHQSRLFNVSSLEFTTAGGDDLHLNASVFVTDAAPTPSAFGAAG